MLVLATSNKNKMWVGWIGPGKVESKISETNYIVSVSGRREKARIHHVNLLKPYVKRVEKINILTREFHDTDESQGDCIFFNRL